MKHAYLILAHNEFEVLRKLISALDDPRNDIFIHFDEKVNKIPDLNTKYANLFVIENRADLRWGDSSIIDAEIRLMDAAVKKGYISNIMYFQALIFLYIRKTIFIIF